MRWVTCLRQSYAILALIISVSLPQVGKAQTSENILIDQLLSNPVLFLKRADPSDLNNLSYPELVSLITDAAEAATPQQISALVEAANTENMPLGALKALERGLSIAAANDTELGQKILRAALNAGGGRILKAINQAREQKRSLFSETATIELEVITPPLRQSTEIPGIAPLMGDTGALSFLSSSIGKSPDIFADPNEGGYVPYVPYYAPSSTQTYYNYERNRFTSLGGGGETPMSPVQ